MPKNRRLFFSLIGLSLLILTIFSPPAFSRAAGRKKAQPAISFIVSMEKPHTHYFQVSLEIEGYSSESINLKLPNWTPGYYRIMDYARHLINFQASDEKGEPLHWEKKAKNIWQIKTGKAKRVIVNYDVYAFNVSIAESFLDDSRAYIVPASLFVHPEGFLQNPVKLKILPRLPFPRLYRA